MTNSGTIVTSATLGGVSYTSDTAHAAADGAQIVAGLVKLREVF